MVLKRGVQQIRRSQFIVQYGPGALIESKNGPRLIPTLYNGLGKLCSAGLLSDHEITDSRLRSALSAITNSDARIFSLPSNAELGRPESSPLYKTYIFPAWRVCYGRKKGHDAVLYNGSDCPLCKSEEESSAVRFVMACINGHLDEVDWDYAVHQGGGCHPGYYFWETGGGAFSEIKVVCNKCKKSVTMQEIYRTDFRCSGRSPETEDPRNATQPPPYLPHPVRPRGCDQKMAVVQRQSSSLRTSETITLLTIPEYDNKISNLLQGRELQASIKTIINLPSKVMAMMSIDDIIDTIRSSGIPDETCTEIKKYIDEHGLPSLIGLIEKLHRPKGTFLDYIYEEFTSLRAGARTSENLNFKMSEHREVMLERGSTRVKLLVYPINRIRTITAQQGFERTPYRKKGTDPRLVYSGVKLLGGEKWYPGYEGIGEGLFITLADDGFPGATDDDHYLQWKDKSPPEDASDPIWGDKAHDPLFVWLHTLSHAIINALALTSGYSSASIKERIYIDKDARTGGILIYTTSPGGDGSMGGLVGAVQRFEEVLNEAKGRLDVCSNDPLCIEVEKSEETVNGAACYSCLLISETSCEHRNRWLDRHIVLGG